MRLFGLSALVFFWVPTQGGLSLASSPPKPSLQAENEIIEGRLRFYESELFHDVQMLPVYNDSKTFPDMMPRAPLEDILAAYEKQKHDATFSLVAFVDQYFNEPDEVAIDDGAAQEGEDLKKYIRRMWPLLTKTFDKAQGSLLPLPKSSIVPGGRFREAYYWDSLFPFLVLLEDSEFQGMAMNLLDNIAYQARQFGYVPNGNRDYYLGRSQPPIMAMMINALFDKDPKQADPYLDALEIEYQFWTSKDDLDSAYPEGRTVTGSDGKKNFPVHIYDAGFGYLPRPEAWKEDVLAKATEGYEIHKPGESQTKTTINTFRDIRASCESGWDFTSRFAVGCNPTACLKTTEIAPVELNTFIQHTAHVLAKIHEHKGDSEKATKYKQDADDKKTILNDYFWDDSTGAFMDRFWRTGQFSQVLTPASIVPLAFNLTSPEKAKRTLETVSSQLLRKGGLVMTKQPTGQQWDAPFGWAPLQYFYIIAALNYGHIKEAQDVAQRWLDMVQANFDECGRIFEKYDVDSAKFTPEGGQYITQAGFAFTNAITYDIIEMLEYLKGHKHKSIA